MSDLSISNTRVKSSIHHKPCRVVVEASMSDSHGEGHYEGFVDRIENVNDGLVNNVLRSDRSWLCIYVLS